MKATLEYMKGFRKDMIEQFMRVSHDPELTAQFIADLDKAIENYMEEIAAAQE